MLQLKSKMDDSKRIDVLETEDSRHKRYREEIEQLKLDFAKQRSQIEQIQQSSSRSVSLNHSAEKAVVMNGHVASAMNTGIRHEDHHAAGSFIPALPNGMDSRAPVGHIGSNMGQLGTLENGAGVHGQYGGHYGQQSTAVSTYGGFVASNGYIPNMVPNGVGHSAGDGGGQSAWTNSGLNNELGNKASNFRDLSTLGYGGTSQYITPSSSHTHKETMNHDVNHYNGTSLTINTSQIRPDLDFEDKIENQRYILEEQFSCEKLQMKKSLQEDFTKAFEMQKEKHEESMRALRRANLELEFQRKEMEINKRHEQGLLEEKYERFKMEVESKIRKEMDEQRARNNIKYETEMKQQREKYEATIEKQQKNIESLTNQIEELNTSLSREKDLIVAKFESEVKEVEETLRLQKEKNDSEMVSKLKNEVNLLKTMCDSLREEIQTKENEKQELETMLKDERRKIEQSYERQIMDLETHFEEEKRVIIENCEEKLSGLFQMEKITLEETIAKLESELMYVKDENESLRALVETNFKMGEEAYQEHDSLLQNVQKENEVLKIKLQETITQHSSNQESQCTFTKRQEQEFSELSSRLERDLKVAIEEKSRLSLYVSELQREIDDVRRKQQEDSTVRDEKESVLKEVTQLHEEIDKMWTDLNEKTKKEKSLCDKINLLQNDLEVKEKEITAFKMEKLESQNRLTIIERQNNDLEENLSLLRRQKIQLDEENDVHRRENVEIKAQVSTLKTTNGSLLNEIQRVNQTVTEREQEIHNLKYSNRDLQHQLKLLQSRQARHQEVMVTQNALSDSERSSTRSTSADERGEKEHDSRSKRKSSLEKQILKLKRSKADYETTIGKLKSDIEDLEKEAMKQIEHNKAVSSDFVSKKRDLERDMDQLKTLKKAIEESIEDSKHSQRTTEAQVASLVKQKRELESSVEYLVQEERRMKEESERDVQEAAKKMEVNVGRHKQDISSLEYQKQQLRHIVERLERDEATLRCNVEELQKESDLLSQRISQMTSDVQQVGKKRVSFEDTESLVVRDMKQEMDRLKSGRDSLLREISELERRQSKLDISVAATERHRDMCDKEADTLSQQKKELESCIFSLKSQKFELESKVNELTMTNMEHSSSTQRKEIEILRNELEVTRATCTDLKTMYHGVQNEGQSKIELVQSELRIAEDSLINMKRERLELEKAISTLLRRKTELDAELTMIADAKYREDRDITILREERFKLDSEVIRVKDQISSLQNTMTKLKDSKEETERELRSLETRKEKVDRYVSGAETSLLIGRMSPLNLNGSREYLLTPRDDLQQQVLDLREQKLALETDLFQLRRKSGDGVDTSRRHEYCSNQRGYGDHLGVTGVNQEFIFHDLKDLSHEKSKLSSELSEMKVRKTDLDAEITNLEYRKLGLEQSGRLVNKLDGGHTSVDGDVHDGKDNNHSKSDLIDYSLSQMQELRKKNSGLEEKLGVLESKLHEATYEMEKQTLEYQKELRLLQNNVRSQQNKEPGQLSSVVERLRNLLRNPEVSSTQQLYDEIRTELKHLHKKVDCNSQQMIELQSKSRSSSHDVLLSTKTVVNGDDADEICGYIREAENGFENYNTIVVNLERANIDLKEIISNLEKRLETAEKSQEILRRKKAILQETLENVGEKTGEDLLEQTNLIFELDKDISL